ncbi:MAG: hypothetical protein EP329_21115 [Deltaproteobacteria bacterium]|nr:MAG: hypothetical protein EP329_21115 [Deltaproteobacteria bacterium]
MRISTHIGGRGLRGVAWACALALTLVACGDDPRPGDDTAGDALTDAADGDDDALEDVGPGDTAVDDDADTAVEDTALADADEDTGAVEDADTSDDTVDLDGADGEDLDATDVEDDTTLADVEDTSSDDALDVDEDETSAAGPFDDLAGLTDDTLRAALLERINGQTALGYAAEGIAREVMWAVLDVQGGRLECIYTGRTVAAENPTAPPLGTADLPDIDTTPNQDCRLPDGTADECLFNAEHSWPRSKGADSGPAESDLHHLFPAYDVANNRRSSYDFGETTCTGNACEWAEGGSELGEREDGSKVFQVRPKFQGDVARAQFYFAVRYQKGIDPTVEATLRAWHAADPVDDMERARNDVIEDWQHNRNPFVDRPDFVDAITNF